DGWLPGDRSTESIRKMILNASNALRMKNYTHATFIIIEAIHYAELNGYWSLYWTAIPIFAELELQRGKVESARRRLEDILPQIARGEDLEQRALTFSVYAKVLMATDTAKSRAEEDYSLLEMHASVQDMLYMQAVIHEALGERSQREIASTRLKEVEILENKVRIELDVGMMELWDVLTNHHELLAVKRILREARQLQEDPATEFVGGPLEDNLFVCIPSGNSPVTSLINRHPCMMQDWHCTLRGPKDTEFEGGLYHVRITLPPTYPFRPPSLRVLTPSGRFEVDTPDKANHNLSIDHEELWQPAWAIIGLQGFFSQSGSHALGVGALNAPVQERKRLATLSREWKCPHCKQKNIDLLPDPVKEDSDADAQVSSHSPVHALPQQQTDQETASYDTPVGDVSASHQAPLVSSESFNTLSAAMTTSSQTQVATPGDTQPYNAQKIYTDTLTRPLNQRENAVNQDQQVQIQAFPAFRNSDPEGLRRPDPDHIRFSSTATQARLSSLTMESGTSTHASVKSQEASVGPLPAYDLFLRALGDSYLNFFIERNSGRHMRAPKFHVLFCIRLDDLVCNMRATRFADICDAYAGFPLQPLASRDGMLRLLQRQRSVDLLFDERLPDRDWTLRRTWRDVCDGLERESEVRGALINSLRMDVVAPLQELKETHERSRKRIKEDIKSSLTQYTDYSENVLPRLKRMYIKRCQDVDELKAASDPKTSSATSPIISNPILPKQSVPFPQGSPVTSQGTGEERKEVEGNRLLPPKASGTGALLVTRPVFLIWPSKAKLGKRQLNNLRTLIDTRASRDGNDLAMRSVRARREADEADKEYRKGVHAMETLRLRRVKTLEAGYTSLETLVNESADTMTKVLERATNVTSSHLLEGLDEVIHQINPAHDLNRLRQLTSASLQNAFPKRILYFNYHAGECRDMLFGVSLLDYASSRGLKDNMPPKIVSICISEVEARGLRSEGIYRMALSAEKSEADFRFDPKDDVFCVGSLLKATLRAILEHLTKVVANVKYNKMDAKNLAVVFGPVILGEEALSTPVDILAMSKVSSLMIISQDTLMEDIISNVRMLYEHSSIDERPASPPLPSPPAHEEAQGQVESSTKRQGNRQHNRRATISSSQADTTPPPSAPPRPSEDGRSTGHIKALSGTPSSTINSRPRLDINNHSASPSISSSPVKETYKDRPSKPSSRNTSEVALTSNFSTSHLTSEAGPSASSLNLPIKTPSYPNSLLHEPAVLLSQANEMNADVQEVDYPGSPDTSALEFRTAVNTPSSEEEPTPFSHL
ncbi:6537_t:CDS:10, partial [Acaulospora colombiana]